MAENRVPCITPGCNRTIQPSTARRTGGYCAPCRGQIIKARQNEYIRNNRRVINPYADVADPVKLIELIQTPRQLDPLLEYVSPPVSIENLYVSLSESDANRLMDLAAAAIQDSNRDFAESTALRLAAFTSFNLDQLLTHWVALGVFRPGLAFRGASEAVRDGVLDAIRNRPVNIDHALQAVAWIGDDVVLEALLEFDKDIEHIRRRLHVAPSAYARIAGWEISHGKRRELTVPACFTIKESPNQADDIQLFERADETCPWCGGGLINLLHIGPRWPARKSIGIEGDRLEVRTCGQCTMYTFVFAELDDAGHGSWARENVRPNYLSATADFELANPWSKKLVGLSARNPLYAADDFLPTTHSQIGGHPAWVQDEEHPACPRCKNTMIFISQIDLGDMPGSEGVFYAFLCTSCRITATSYQQT